MGCFLLLAVLIKKVFRYGKTQNPQKNVFRKIFPREIFTERTLRDSLKHFFFLPRGREISSRICRVN